MAEAPQPNSTFSRPPFFILTGLPGLGGAQAWLTLVFGPMYLLALLGNGALLAVVHADTALHQPMFLLLAVLVATDLGLATSVAPGLLAVLWLGPRPVPYAACLVQMFFVHALTAVESGVLLAMACDRAVAVGRPLHYPVLVTKARVGYAALALALKAVAIVVPFPLLVARFGHFRARTIAHAYCAHMAVVELVVGDTRANNLYGLALSLAVSSVDILGITGSYGLIAHAVLRLPTREARAKALGTCSSHVGVILAFSVPGLFSYLTHRCGRRTAPKPVHILLSDVYLLLPPALNPLIYGPHQADQGPAPGNLHTQQEPVLRGRESPGGADDVISAPQSAHDCDNRSTGICWAGSAAGTAASGDGPVRLGRRQEAGYQATRQRK